MTRLTVSSTQQGSHITSLGRPCCTQFGKFQKFQVNQLNESQLMSQLLSSLQPSRSSASRLTTTLLTASRSTVSKYCSNLQLTWPPSANPNSRILASKWISNIARTEPPRTSLRSHYHGACESTHCNRRGCVRMSCFHSRRSIGRVWEDIMGYPAIKVHTNFVDLWKLSKCVWGTKLNGWIYECSARVYGTRS